ncbi:PEP-CTERM sorting domain-containing protein [Akkermansiaceae bacterium]|nr:PEP-CTERM sorting domain-containing protein [Akkermansiaceae bacterium]
MRIFQIEPDLNNEIFINVERGPNNDNGNGFFYFGLMQIDSRPIPEPSTSLILLAGAMTTLLRRRRQ